jgi:hypothetical protein
MNRHWESSRCGSWAAGSLEALGRCWEALGVLDGESIKDI